MRILVSISVLLISVGGILPIRANKVPSLELRFNESGTSPDNTGTDQHATATMFDDQSEESDLHSVDAGGVSGKLKDRAFENRGATAMGFRQVEGEVSSSGGYIELHNVAEALVGARSLTLTCWAKASEQCLGANARLVDLAYLRPGRRPGETGSGLSLRATGDMESGRCAIELFQEDDDGRVTQLYASSKGGVLKQVDEWIFLAVVYDGTASSGPGFTFYQGDTSNPPTMVFDARSEKTGRLSIAPQAKSAIGNAPDSTTAPFQGFVDNVRVYISTADHRGALNADQLDTIRLADLENSQPQP